MLRTRRKARNSRYEPFLASPPLAGAYPDWLGQNRRLGEFHRELDPVWTSK